MSNPLDFRFVALPEGPPFMVVFIRILMVQVKFLCICVVNLITNF